MKFWFLSPLAAAALAGCGSSAPPQTFAPLDYSYLPPLVLKVSTLNVVNNYVPSPSAATVIGQDPAPPATVLLTMLNHRIVASGAPGTGTVTIQTASIDRIGGNLAGAMTVDVNVSSPDGRSTGYTEASITASQTAPDPDASQADTQAALYGLTKRMMDSMNVQLQYQMQHNLSTWMSWSATPGAGAFGAMPLSGGAPDANAIQTTPLNGPGSLPAGAPAALAPMAAPAAVPTAVPSYLPGAGPSAPTPLTPPPGQ